MLRARRNVKGLLAPLLAPAPFYRHRKPKAQAEENRMSLDHYKTLGRSGLRVSPFCLGTMTFGNEWGFGADEKTSGEILSYYLDQGGNFIDTANVYNKGHSEEIIGDYFRNAPGKRDRIVLATKFGGNMHPGDANSGGANRKAVVAACEASLRRLKTDYIDLYWQHWEDPFCPLDETMRALDDLVTAGKIRYIGFSDTPAWKVAAAHVTAQLRGWTPLVALQLEYSLLERTVEGELLPMAQEFGLGVSPWSPLAAGVLTGKYGRGNMQAKSAGRAGSVARYVNEQTYAVLDVLSAVAERRSSSPAHVALAWVRQRPGICSPTLGARTLEQLKENIAALDVTLEPAEMAELDAVSTPTLNFPATMIKGAYAVTFPNMSINGQYFGGSPMEKKSS
jgi:aryl-alcohol dehydrogenase-like predicted oxidoreductase